MEIWESLSILALDQKSESTVAFQAWGGDMRVTWLPEAKEEHRGAEADMTLGGS